MHHSLLRLLACLCGFLFYVISAHAFTPDLLLGHLGVNYSTMSVVPSLNQPVMVGGTVGGVAAIRLHDSWLGGVATDFDFVRQVSDSIRSGGSYSGSRWNILSPTLGYQSGDWIFLGELEVLGSYRLTTKSLSGADVAFGMPFGGRFRGIKQCWGKWGIGAHAEILGFGSRNSVGLVNRQKLWQFGAQLSYLF